MTKKEVNKIAKTSPDSVLIGAEGEREQYYTAIVAFDNIAKLYREGLR